MKSMQKIDNTDKPVVTREMVRSSLSIPADYYIDRGYSQQIMNKYDVGLCSNPKREMYNRVVVPIYDMNYETMVGCTGRSIYEKCDKCGGFHNPSNDCPSAENLWKYSKWKHNSGFKTQEYLYNFWFAKEHILESGTVVLVEGPGDVWKLEQNGIHNSLAMFGTDLSEQQLSLLYSCGANSIVVLTDNDEAGRMSAEKIGEKCGRLFRMFFPTMSCADVGDMTRDNIEQEIKPILTEAMEIGV